MQQNQGVATRGSDVCPRHVQPIIHMTQSNHISTSYRDAANSHIRLSRCESGLSLATEQLHAQEALIADQNDHIQV